MVLSSWVLAVLFPFLPSLSEGFGIVTTDVMTRPRSGCHEFSRPSSSSSALYMGKGFRRMKKKQEDIERMREEARLERLEQDGEAESSELSSEEIKEKNDRKRFEELLTRQPFGIDIHDDDNDAYLNVAEEEALAANYLFAPLLFEGDPAPTQCFEELVHIKTGNAIGNAGRLVPWLHKSPARHKDFLVIVCHPNEHDTDLRETMRDLPRKLPDEIMKRLIFINPDTPKENRRWLKKGGLLDKISVYSDEKLNWMRSYTAVGTEYAYMSIFVIARGRIQKIVREADSSFPDIRIKKMIKSMIKDNELRG